MYPLFETIRIQNGKPKSLPLHQERINYSCKQLFGRQKGPSLDQSIRVPDEFTSGIVRCRYSYDAKDCRVEYSPYDRKMLETLKVVKDDDIEYSLKFTDRSRLNELLLLKGTCDDILIVKDQRITDTSYANIAFCNGREWFTPVHPLLHGTRRRRLIDEGILIEEEIRVKDLKKFKGFIIFNAMIEFNENEMKDIQNIRS